LFRYSKKLKEQLIAPRKFYTIDNGIINIIGFKASSEIGRLMENLVSIELFRRKSYWHNNWEIFYWKDHQQNEVDFVVKEGIEIKQLIQVTYANGRDEIEKREIKSLIKASNQFKCKNLLVITWDYEDKQEIENKNILYLPLWKWLINI
jgi:predicted AAA+ superfamily ATPase